MEWSTCRVIKISGRDSSWLSTCLLLRWVAPYSRRSIGFQFGDGNHSSGGDGIASAPSSCRSEKTNDSCRQCNSVHSSKIPSFCVANRLWLAGNPAYSFNLTPSNFFLVGHVKYCLQGMTSPSREELSTAIRQKVAAIPK
jgi:hypothetical protein